MVNINFNHTPLNKNNIPTLSAPRVAARPEDSVEADGGVDATCRRSPEVLGVRYEALSRKWRHPPKVGGVYMSRSRRGTSEDPGCVPWAWPESGIGLSRSIC